MTTKREQHRELESQVNTRQDRNTYLTDGGYWSWDSGTNTLAWDASFVLRRGGATVHTVAAGSVVGLSTNGHIAYLEVDRVGGGPLTLLGGTSPGPLRSIFEAANATDNVLVIAIRGTDDRIYLRDGTVLSNGESKRLGTLNTLTDRNDVLAVSGQALYPVGFAYLVGSKQLVVYVGGILQIEGTHYTETSATEITFTAGNEPSTSEVISFVNIIGGEGPSGTSLAPLQDVFDNGPNVNADVVADFMYLYRALGTNPVFAVGLGPDKNPFYAPFNGDNTAQFTADGNLWFNNPLAGLTLIDGGGPLGYWMLHALDDASGSLLLANVLGEGARVARDGSGMEWGTYTGGYPGGSWAGDGSLRWSVVTGTLPASGSEDIVLTGVSSIMGVVLSVQDSNIGGGIRLALEAGTGQFTSKQHAVVIDNSLNKITIRRSWTDADLSGSPHIASQPYTAIIFHQG